MRTTTLDRPRWRIVYEYIKTLDIGDIVTEDELMALMPDAPTMNAVIAAFHSALAVLETNDSRSFDRVRLVGWRMVEAREHESLARRQHRRSRRRLQAASRKAHAADRGRLTAEERARMDAIEMNLARQEDMIRRLESRQQRTDARVAVTEKDAAALADRLDRIGDMLRRHGITDER
jgi:hypothetical protein